MSVTSFDRKACHDLESAARQEWRQENKIGGYAASTIVGANTKPDHGLLVRRDRSLAKAQNLLSTLEETVFIGEKSFPISTRFHTDMVYPQGYEHLDHFYLAPYPAWIYQIEALKFLKMVILLDGEDAVLIRYQLLSSYGDYVRLEVRPILGFRGLQKEAENALLLKAKSGFLELAPVDKTYPALFMYHNAAVIDRASRWIKNIRYPEAEKLGGCSQENLWSPCSLMHAFAKEDGAFLCVSTAPKDNCQVLATQKISLSQQLTKKR